MQSKLSRFLTIAALTTLTCVIVHPSASAQNNTNAQQSVTSKTEVATPEIEPTIPVDISRLLNRAFWQYGGDFFEQSSLGGMLNTIFGARSFPQGSFPENNITNDGLLLYAIMDDYFRQIQTRDTTIRTRDLKNPFNSSVREEEMD